MGVNKTSDITSVGDDVLSTSQSSQTGLVTAQLGDVVTEDVKSNEAEWYYPPGLVSRPRKPDPKQKAAQVALIRRSGHDAIVGCRDERVASIIGQLDDGETAVFAPASGGAVALFRKDGSVVLQNGTNGGHVSIDSSGAVQAFGSSVALGSQSAQALAFGSALQIVTDALSAFATTVQGDAALKVVALNTVTAAGALVTALSALVAGFATLGQTTTTTGS